MANNVNVVNRGFEYICNYLTGTATTANWTSPTTIGWGGANGYNSVSVVLPASGPTTVITTGQWMDVAPYQEFAEARIAGTPSVTGTTAAASSVTTQVVGTITSLSGQSVGESFLVMKTTKPSSYILNSNVTVDATAFTVTTGTLTNGYYQLNNEVVQITGVTSNTIASTVIRAANGSTANTAKTNDVITLGNIPGAGLSDPNNADLFAHAGFIALALNTGDSIQFTWQINVTS